MQSQPLSSWKEPLLSPLGCTKGKSHLIAMHAGNSLFPHCLMTIRSPLVYCLFTLCSPYLGRRNAQEEPPLGTKSRHQGHEGSATIFVYYNMWCGTTSGMTRNFQYFSSVDMDHKRCKYGPAKNIQNLHLSTQSFAHSIIFHFLPSIQILIISSYAPNVCVDSES